MLSGNFSVVSLAQTLSPLETPPRLWLVTRGAQSVGKDVTTTSPLQAGVWGLNRVIVNEMPNLRPAVVDLSHDATPIEIASLCQELLLDDPEDEIALRGDARFVHRFARLFRISSSVDGANHEESRRFRLEPAGNHTLEKLTFREARPMVLGPDDVEIEVAAAALNFSDVMKALGIYPGLDQGPVPLGIKCAGRVSRIGDKVRDLNVGDEVMAIAPFSFASHTVTTASLVAKKPASMTFEDAATIPIAFLTASYALNFLGHMAEGERVLIHAATGGVGLAAIQLAQRAGAEVFATAGTAEKRELLHSLGVKHVMDSRTLLFADQVMEATNGEGVDLVLNSLAGAAIDKGLSVLRDGGRFLEIGKRDIYEQNRIGLRPFRKNLSFTAIDLDKGLRERRAQVAGVFRNVVEQFENGDLRPLPHRIFSAPNIVNAFRYMAQAKHIGKVVVSFQEQRVPIAPVFDGSIQFRENATYLITGGLGGFGLTIAKWMVERGARNMVLMGRRGLYSDEARAAVETMKQAGANVVVAAADVSNAEQVAGVLADIRQNMPPLKGILHGAMVLRDCLLLNMTEDQMRDVWGPKVLGAWNLCNQTKEDDLDFLFLFSSVSSIVGTGGQANYASANTVLDSLSYDCCARGINALTISWGYLGQVGFVADHDDIAKRFEAMGVSSFSPHEALTLLARFLQVNPVHAGIMRVDWRAWKSNAAQRALSPRFIEMIPESNESSESSDKQSGAALRAALREATPAERREMIEGLLRKQVARVLGMSPSKLDVEKPLTDLGLDSLMAVELRNWVEGDLQLSLPTVELLRGPSVLQLAEIMLKQLSKHDGTPAATTDEAQVSATQAAEPGTNGKHAESENIEAYVDELSEVEVDALLGDLAAEERQD
jgi:NADPH:quinone reductase-like Zn-dependent oxidoreductase/aryl carrier-like protein